MMPLFQGAQNILQTTRQFQSIMIKPTAVSIPFHRNKTQYPK